MTCLPDACCGNTEIRRGLGEERHRRLQQRSEPAEGARGQDQWQGGEREPTAEPLQAEAHRAEGECWRERHQTQGQSADSRSWMYE